jgi:hypothetical protein
MMAAETYLFGEKIVDEKFADTMEPAGDGPDAMEEAVALAQAAVAETLSKLEGRSEDVGKIAAMLDFGNENYTPGVAGEKPAAKAENEKGGVKMDISTLKNEHPAVFAEAVRGEFEKGVESERARTAELRAYVDADPENSRVREVVEAAIAEGKTVAEVNAKLQVAIRDGGKLDGENAPAIATAEDRIGEKPATDEERELAKALGVSVEDIRASKEAE